MASRKVEAELEVSTRTTKEVDEHTNSDCNAQLVETHHEHWPVERAHAYAAEHHDAQPIPVLISAMCLYITS